MTTKQMSVPSIMQAIETLQEVQKGCSPVTREWMEASKILHALYAEMAVR